MCDTIDKIKIVEGFGESAGINSVGKLVLWKHSKTDYETLETDIICKDICLYNQRGLGRWVIIDKYNRLNFVNVTAYPGPRRTTRWKVDLESLNLDLQAKKILSIPSRSNMLILDDEGVIQAYGDNVLDFPKNPEFNTVYKDIALSEKFGVGLTHNGTIFSWGEYSSENIKVPLRFYNPSSGGPKISKIISGKNVVLVLYENGKIDGWGNNKYKQLNIPDVLKKDSLSNVFVKDLAITNTLCFASIEFLDSPLYNSVIYWGDKSTISLSSQGSIDVSKFNYAVESPYFFHTSNPISNSKLRNLYCGRNSIYGVLDDGKIVSWGLSESKIDVYIPDLYVKTKNAFNLRIDNYGFNTKIDKLISKINNQIVDIEDFTYSLQNFKMDKIATKEDLNALKSRGTIRSVFQIVDSSGRIVKNFEKQKFLGAGTYGAVYSIEDLDTSKNYTIKVPRNFEREPQLNDFTEEILTQIILYNKSIEFYGGPICSEVLMVALMKFSISSDTQTKDFSFPVIIQESIDTTLGDYYNNNHNQIVYDNSRTPEEALYDLANLEANLLKGIYMLANKLNFVNKLQNFEFNHRDMKTDNIMVNIKADGSIKNIFLIDFGLSCLNINGYKLGSSKLNSVFRKSKCFIPSRDLSALILSLIVTFYNKQTNTSFFTEDMLKFLEFLTTFYVKNKPCNVSKGCEYEISNNPLYTDFGKIDPISGKNTLTIFSQSYYFFNKSYVFNPKTSPGNLMILIREYLSNGFNIDNLSKYTPYFGEFLSNDNTSNYPKVTKLQELNYDVVDENLPPESIKSDL